VLLPSHIASEYFHIFIFRTASRRANPRDTGFGNYSNSAWPFCTIAAHLRVIQSISQQPRAIHLRKLAHTCAPPSYTMSYFLRILDALLPPAEHQQCHSFQYIVISVSYIARVRSILFTRYITPTCTLNKYFDDFMYFISPKNAQCCYQAIVTQLSMLLFWLYLKNNLQSIHENFYSHVTHYPAQLLIFTEFSALFPPV
jgi:hypothetical protein